MKTFIPRFAFQLCLALALVWSGSPGTLRAAGLPASSNSFAAVTAHLDPGGSVYLYLSTEAWLSDLSSKVSGWRQFLMNIPGIGETELKSVNQGFDITSRLIKKSGIENISGLGLSGVLRPDGLYRTKFVLHHYPNRDQGFLWSLLGDAPHPLKTLGYLPANTVVAANSDLDLVMLWNLIEGEIQEAHIAEASQGLEHFKEMVKSQTGLGVEQILASLGGSMTLVLTLDENRKFMAPSGGDKPLEIPEPRLGLLIKVKDATLFDILDKPLQKQEQVVKVDKPGLKMRTLPLPLPLPVRPTVAQTDEYLILATQESLVEEMLAAARGEGPRLETSAEFKRLSEGVPMEGNQFNFMSRRFGIEVSRILRSVLEARGGGSTPPAALMDKMMAFDKVLFGVTRITPEGLLATANQSEHPGMMIAAPAMLAPVAVLAGLGLPAIAKAKVKAQSISCVNNLKQISISARIYADAHNDRLPLNFLEMKDELASPKALACPSDHTKARAEDWAQYDPENNLSYEFVSPGAGDGDPGLVVFRCPIHGHEAMADGSVKQGARQ